jgi:ABC-type amino acid transport substrate-binding protein
MKLFIRLLMLTLALSALALAVACGSGREDDEAPAATGTTAAPKATAAAFPAGSTMDTIAKRGKIVVGVKYDVPLFGLLDPATKKVDGFDVAIGKEIAKALGLREDQVEFIEAISANRIPYLQEDKADLIISTMTINADRKTQIEFSRPYYLAGQSILVKSDSAIKGVNDLNGKNVCSVQGSTSEKNVVEKAPQTQLTSFTTYSACVQAMKDGRVEAVTTDDIILAGFAASDKTLKLVGGTFTTEAYGIGIKKGKTDLATFVTGVLNDMMKDGRWERLYQQYLGQAPGLPPAKEALEKVPATA